MTNCTFVFLLGGSIEELPKFHWPNISIWMLHADKGELAYISQLAELQYNLELTQSSKEENCFAILFFVFGQRLWLQACMLDLMQLPAFSWSKSYSIVGPRIATCQCYQQKVFPKLPWSQTCVWEQHITFLSGKLQWPTNLKIESWIQ